MKIVELNAEIVDNTSRAAYEAMVNKVVKASSLCWDKPIPRTLAEKERYIKARIKVGHMSVTEHVNISVLFTIDRGLSHELVRHRIAAYTQSSTRYINYSDLPVIVPFQLRHRENPIYNKAYEVWEQHMMDTEARYKMLDNLELPRDAVRSILPNCLATQVLATYNVRTWRHVLALRNLGLRGRPHPDMISVMKIADSKLREAYPVFFDDITDVDA